jgi:hypothetical protein
MKTEEEVNKKAEKDEASAGVEEDPGDDVRAESSFALRNMMPQGLLQLQLLNFLQLPPSKRLNFFQLPLPQPMSLLQLFNYHHLSLRPFSKCHGHRLRLHAFNYHCLGLKPSSISPNPCRRLEYFPSFK